MRSRSLASAAAHSRLITEHLKARMRHSPTTKSRCIFPTHRYTDLSCEPLRCLAFQRQTERVMSPGTISPSPGTKNDHVQSQRHKVTYLPTLRLSGAKHLLHINKMMTNAPRRQLCHNTCRSSKQQPSIYLACFKLRREREKKDKWLLCAYEAQETGKGYFVHCIFLSMTASILTCVIA